MADKPIDLKQVASDCREFAQQFQSLQLATTSGEGVPEASYAPFFRDGRDFYVYVSELSRHTANLSQNPRASVLLIENEADARHLFARRRLTYQCDCEEVPRGSDPFDTALDGFQEKFGDFIGMLRNLEDFHLFRVSPYTGTFVTGFARAFEMIGEQLDEVRHINDVGHRAANKKTDEQMAETEKQQNEPA